MRQKVKEEDKARSEKGHPSCKPFEWSELCSIMHTICPRTTNQE